MTETRFAPPPAARPTRAAGLSSFIPDVTHSIESATAMMLTVKEVAQRLNVSPSCIYQLVESGRIPHHRIGLGRGAIRFTEDDITEYLMSNREESHTKESVPTIRTRRLKHIKL